MFITNMKIKSLVYTLWGDSSAKNYIKGVAV